MPAFRANVYAGILFATLFWFALHRWWAVAPAWTVPALVGLGMAHVVRLRALPYVLPVPVVMAALLPAGPLWPGVAAAAVLPGLTALAAMRLRLLPLATVALILLGFAAQAWRQPKLDAELAAKPAPESYSYDPYIYLRTHHLMREGRGYYEAFAAANVDDARLDRPPASVLGWRLPTVAWLWRLAGLRAAFVAFAMAAVVLAFLVAREVSGAGFAQLPAALVCGCEWSGASSTRLLFHEYWALPLALGAALLFLQGRVRTAAALSAFVPLVREVFVFPLAAGAAVEHRKPAPWIIAGACALALYAAHALAVRAVVPDAGFGAGHLQGGGVRLVTASLEFSWLATTGSRWYIGGLCLLGIAGLARVTPVRSRAYLLALAVLPPLLFLVWGNRWQSYWGLAYTPFAILGLAPLLAWVEGLGGQSHVSRCTYHVVDFNSLLSLRRDPQEAQL